MISFMILAFVMLVLAFFFWPAAVVTMKAPGATGWVISRAAFETFPKLYFFLLRHWGTAAAGFTFSVLLPWVVVVLAFVLTVVYWYVYGGDTDGMVTTS